MRIFKKKLVIGSLIISLLNIVGCKAIIRHEPQATSEPSLSVLLPQYDPSWGPKKRIAVMRFENKTSYTSGGQIDLGNGMAEQLTTALFKTGGFIVLERQAIDDILREQDFGKTGRVDIDTAPKIGKILGAELIIVGAITAYEPGHAEVGFGVGKVSVMPSGVASAGFVSSMIGGSIGIRQAYIAIDLRVVDVETGVVLNATSVEGIPREIGGKIGVDLGKVDFGTIAFYKTPIGQAVRDCINKSVDIIVKTAFPGAISVKDSGWLPYKNEEFTVALPPTWVKIEIEDFIKTLKEKNLKVASDIRYKFYGMDFTPESRAIMRDTGLATSILIFEQSLMKETQLYASLVLELEKNPNVVKPVLYRRMRLTAGEGAELKVRKKVVSNNKNITISQTWYIINKEKKYYYIIFTTIDDQTKKYTPIFEKVAQTFIFVKSQKEISQSTTPTPQKESTIKPSKAPSKPKTPQVPSAEPATILTPGVEIIQKPRFVEGDTWIRQTDKGKFIWEVEKVDDLWIIFRQGEHKYFYNTNLAFVKRVSRGKTAYEHYPPSEGRFFFPLWVGKKWESNYTERNFEKGTVYNFKELYEVKDIEDIQTPAGTFKALRIEVTMENLDTRRSWTYTLWYSPEVKNLVKSSSNDLKDRNWILADFSIKKIETQTPEIPLMKPVEPKVEKSKESETKPIP
jgi:curli biogenesis system outer membrane secretion channel CsgG